MILFSTKIEIESEWPCPNRFTIQWFGWNLCPKIQRLGCDVITKKSTSSYDGWVRILMELWSTSLLNSTNKKMGIWI